MYGFNLYRFCLEVNTFHISHDKTNSDKNRTQFSARISLDKMQKYLSGELDSHFTIKELNE